MNQREIILWDLGHSLHYLTIFSRVFFRINTKSIDIVLSHLKKRKKMEYDNYAI